MKLGLLSLFVCGAISFSSDCFAQTFPPPIPPGPLGDVDNRFLEEYTARMKAIENTHLLYVEVSGNNLILHHDGKIETKRVLPDTYHALKDVAHIPFLTYLRLKSIANSGQEITDTEISELKTMSAEIVAARSALGTGHFDDAQLARQSTMIEESLDLLQSTIDKRLIDSTKLAGFATTMGPLMMQDSNEAACYQVREMHMQMMTWKDDLSREEWSRLIAVNVGGHQPRYRNVATQYFAWLFDGSTPEWAYPGESARVIYEESLPRTESVEDELAAILLDAEVSQAFLHNRWRLSEDILSDGAAACIAKLPIGDRIWHSRQ